MQQKTVRMPAIKRISLIAHDNMKPVLSDWCRQHQSLLSQHQLFATGTTGHKLSSELGLSIESLISGPLGGDQQIGAKIVEQKIDMVVFFWDPFEPMPHDPDVKALLRIAAVWNVAVACNRTSADFMLTSLLTAQGYDYQIPDYDAYLAERLDQHGSAE
ncbi:methylglyoxal synthase [Oceanobacter kriegii]